MTEQTLKDIDRAFRALEERNELLDKIKTDIRKELTRNNHAWFKAGLKFCIDIINKYEESEE